MVHIIDDIRLIVEFLCGLALILFIAGILLFAAITVGWACFIGMMIVFSIEFWHRVFHDS